MSTYYLLMCGIVFISFTAKDQIFKTDHKRAVGIHRPCETASPYYLTVDFMSLFKALLPRQSPMFPSTLPNLVTWAENLQSQVDIL